MSKHEQEPETQNTPSDPPTILDQLYPGVPDDGGDRCEAMMLQVEQQLRAVGVKVDRSFGETPLAQAIRLYALEMADFAASDDPSYVAERLHSARTEFIPLLGAGQRIEPCRAPSAEIVTITKHLRYRWPSCTFQEVVAVDGQRFSIAIESSAELNRTGSFATVARWSGIDWKMVHSMPDEELKTPPADRNLDESSFKADRDELLRIALAVTTP